MAITKRHSLWLLAIMMILLVSLRFTRSFDSAISWDVKGYYLYLPALFIYGDPGIQDLGWVNEILEKYNTSATLYMLNPAESGGHVIKYTMGLAWMYFPFFWAGHLMASISAHWPADGFSIPYQYALSLGVFLYVGLGLWFLRKILHHYFDAKTVFITLFAMVFGTNLLNQFAFQALLSHTSLFFLMAALIWNTIVFYEKLSRLMKTGDIQHEKGISSSNLYLPPGNALAHFVLIAVLCGLITLIRPTEAVCLSLFVFWGTNSYRALKQRILFFLQRPFWILLFIMLALLVILPQMCYWKSLTGQFLHYSYDNAGEGLDLLNPHAWKFLFSFRKGWLIYTPMMWISLIGLLLLYKKDRRLFYPIVLFFLSSLYLMSSWTTWWYAGGCFSSRTMISVYPALSIPLAYAFRHFLNQRRHLRFLAGLVVVFFIVLNLFQTWQHRKGIISLETMTREYYFRSFFKTSVTDEDRKLLLINRSLTAEEQFTGEGAYTSRILVDESFSTAHFQGYRYACPFQENGCLMMVIDSLTPFSPVFEKRFSELTNKDHAWLRTRVEIYIPESYTDVDPLLVLTFSHKDVNYKYRSSEKLIELSPGKMNTIEMDYLTPEVRSKTDVFKMYIWHRGKQAVYLDRMMLEVFVPD